MNRTKVLCYVALVAGAGAGGVQLLPRWLTRQATRPLDRELAAALETAQAVGFGGVALLALVGVVVALLVKNDQRAAASRALPAPDRAAPPGEPTGSAPLSATALAIPRGTKPAEPAAPAPAEAPAAAASPSSPAAPATLDWSATAPSTATATGSGAVSSPSAQVDEEAHWKAIYADFQRVRAECGEPEAPVYDRFREKLQKNREQLVERFGCRTVKFQVYVKDGKAALKASPVR